MKVLVTGATGFIGSYVYQNLAASKQEIYAVSRNKKVNNKNFYKIDILNHKDVEEFLKLIKPDILVHLAWDVEHGKFWNSSKNILYKKATINLFDVFLDHGGTKIIAAGTCAEYSPSTKALKEEEVPQLHELLTPYGQAKREIYEYLENLRKNKVFEFTWLRIFGVFGPGEDKRRFFPSSIQSILSNSPFTIHNPSGLCDYIYVKDMAKFISSCVDRSGYGPINIGSGKAIEIEYLYKLLQEYVKKKKIMEHAIKDESKSQDCSKMFYIPNCEKIQKAGFTFTLEKGIEETIDYYRGFNG